MNSGKVYVINDRKPPASPPERAKRRATKTVGATRPRTSGVNWTLALGTYAFGPLSLILRPRGKGGMVWAIIGGVCLVATAVFWLNWVPFVDVLEPADGGAAAWVVLAALVMLLLATAWARTVATSERVTRWPRLLRVSGIVCSLGFILPGLGLFIAGRKLKAASAIWFAGLLIAGLTVLKNWRSLAEHRDVQAGFTSRQAEMILMIAAVAAVVGLLAWVVQALDGIRAVSPRSGQAANGLSLVMLAALVLGLTTFHPASVARELGTIAMPLREHGLRIIPLALYEAASTFDPGEATYLATTETIYEELGKHETAEAKRALLRTRATQFADAIGAELVPHGMREASLPWRDENSKWREADLLVPPPPRSGEE